MGREVLGEGPQPARVLVLGEAPGKDEDRAGRPFIGASGREVRMFLNGRDLPDEDDVRIENVCREWPGEGKDMTEALAEKWRAALWESLALTQPELVVCLGRWAAKEMLGSWVDMDTHHGFLYPGVHHAAGVFDVFVAYHPAAGLHIPDLYARWRYDIEERLVPYLQRGVDVTWHEWARPETYAVNEPPPMDTVMHVPGFGERLVLAIDTEGTAEDLICLTWSDADDRAGWVDQGDAAWEAIADYARCDGVLVAMHHAMHDAPLLAKHGIEPREMVDTMVLAYHLGREAQGLKPLGYRYAGLMMRDYMDVVGPHEERVVREVLEGALVRGELPKKVATSVKRMLTTSAKMSLRERWEKSTGAKTGAVHVPAVTLRDVPRDEAVAYACDDALATRRILLPLAIQAHARGLL